MNVLVEHATGHKVPRLQWVVWNWVSPTLV